MDTSDGIELRGMCPRETVDVLDAVSAARSMSRAQIVNEILGDWARQQMHVATVLHRVLRRNPQGPESGGRGAA